MKIEISRTAQGNRLDAEQWFSQPVEALFPFFARASNLERITPPFLKFKMLSPEPDQITEGTLIDYQLRLHGIPIRWRTRIAVWDPPHRFVDEQIKGPYRKWWHEHTFERMDGGTLAKDHVDYLVPGGQLIHQLLVKKDVQQIFAYRAQTLAQIFAATAAATPTPAN